MAVSEAKMFRALETKGIIHRAFLTILTLAGCLGQLQGCGGVSPLPIQVAIASPMSSPTIDQGQNVNITASVSEGASNRGVNWSIASAGCASGVCGSLTNQTPASVTYNAPASVPAILTVVVTATSIADASKSASVSITVEPLTVAISNKVSELAAGTSPSGFLVAQFRASVQNDPNFAGVTWTLKVNGIPCSPACGSLSGISSFGVSYTPPPTVPLAPDNMPTITATSMTDTTKSDADAFTIFDGATTCRTGGNEAVFKGDYAIMVQGWRGSGVGTPITYAASFTADGTGKITFGQDQYNPYANNAYAGATVIPSASSYSVGPDDRGCLTLTDTLEHTFTFQFALGGVNAGVASRGDVIFFDEQTTIPEHGSGILRLQDPSAFSLTALAPNYAFGVDGWNNSSGSLTHFAMAGSFAQSGGTLSNAVLDANDGGSLVTTGGHVGMISLGTIGTIASGDGQATASLSLPGNSSSTQVVIYVINSSELFLVSISLSGQGPEFSGRAIASPSSFSASSVSPNYILHLTGSSSGSASASVGLASFSSGLQGTVSESLEQYSRGLATAPNFTGNYGLGTAAGGRLVIFPSGQAPTQIVYLTNPVDDVSGFAITTDSTASFGIFDTQPATTYSNGTLSGNFFFGSAEPGDNSVTDLSGVTSISAGSITGTEDVSSLSGLVLDSPMNAALSINADGTGNLGSSTVAVTNGSELFFIDETGTLPPVVQVLEK